MVVDCSSLDYTPNYYQPPQETFLLSESGRTAGDGGLSELLGDNLSGSDHWEAEILGEILISVASLDLSITDDGSLDDLNVASHSSVSTGHVVVHLSDSSSQCGVSVLLVHIVSSASASVSEPNGEVLHLCGVLLKDLGDVQDFTTCSLSLGQGLHIVPELRLSNNFVSGEYLHSENLRAGVLSCWGSTTDQLVEVHLFKRVV